MVVIQFHIYHSQFIIFQVLCSTMVIREDEYIGSVVFGDIHKKKYMCTTTTWGCDRVVDFITANAAKFAILCSRPTERSLHCQVENHVRIKFATPILYAIDNFKNYDIFSIYT